MSRSEKQFLGRGTTGLASGAFDTPEKENIMIRKTILNRLHHAVCAFRSEEHTSEPQSLTHLVCRLLLEKKQLTAGSALESLTQSVDPVSFTPAAAGCVVICSRHVHHAVSAGACMRGFFFF